MVKTLPGLPKALNSDASSRCFLFWTHLQKASKIGIPNVWGVVNWNPHITLAVLLFESLGGCLLQIQGFSALRSARILSTLDDQVERPETAETEATEGWGFKGGKGPSNGPPQKGIWALRSGPKRHQKTPKVGK